MPSQVSVISIFLSFLQEVAFEKLQACSTRSELGGIRERVQKKTVPALSCDQSSFITGQKLWPLSVLVPTAAVFFLRRRNLPFELYAGGGVKG